MATIKFYTDTVDGPSKNVPLNRFDIGSLEKGIDYTIGLGIANEIFKGPEGISNNLYFGRFNLLTARALDALELRDSDDPFQHFNYIRTFPSSGADEAWHPSNFDIESEPLDTPPSDWELNWRTKYVKKGVYTKVISESEDEEEGKTVDFYTIFGTPAGGTSTLPSQPEFIADEYYKANSARQSFFTAGGNYLIVSHDYKFQLGTNDSIIETISCNFTPNIGSGNNQTDRYINSWRMRGINGEPVLRTSPTAYAQTMQYNKITSYPLYTEITQKVFVNFVGFTYTFEEEQDGETVEKSVDFVGICFYERDPSNIVISASILAISVPFWIAASSEGYWGPSSGIKGGEGLFDAPSDSQGDYNGVYVKQQVSRLNKNLSHLLSTEGSGYHIYAGSVNKLALLLGELWTVNGKDSFIQYFKDDLAQVRLSPISAFINCYLIPPDFVKESDGVETQVRAAGYPFTTQMGLLDEIQKEIHLGGIDLTALYSDSFADFGGFTSISLYLPFIGLVDLDINSCQGGFLSVDYVCDLMTGDVSAIVWVQDQFGNNHNAYEYKGNLAYAIHIFGATDNRPQTLFSLAQHSVQQVSTMGQTVAGVLTSGVMGGGAAAGGNTDLIGNVANAATNNLSQLKQNTMNIGKDVIDLAHPQQSITHAVYSQGYSSYTGLDCFAIIRIPQWVNPEKYQSLIGLPSEISGTINQSDLLEHYPFQGYLSVKEVKLDGITATDVERKEIESLLKSGVYV